MRAGDFELRQGAAAADDLQRLGGGHAGDTRDALGSVFSGHTDPLWRPFFCALPSLAIWDAERNAYRTVRVF